MVRERLAFYAEHRYFAPDLAAMSDFIASGMPTEAIAALLPYWNG